MSARPVLAHVTTTDISLALLLGPQLRAFADAGYDVVGVSAPGPYVAELESWGIRHIGLQHATRAMAPQRDLAALVELRRVFRRLAPAIVHTHNPKPGIYGRLAARAARVPTIVNTVHGLYALPEDRWAKRAVVYSLERIAATCSHAELVQNPEDIEVLRRLGVPADRVHLLGNGIDLARFDPARVSPARRDALRAEWGVDRDAVVVGVVGRLVEEKGYREVIATASALATRAPTLTFVVVGPEEPDKSDGLDTSLVARARDLPNVRVLGLRSDVDELYTAFDVYALASYREGFPRSAMEAAAMGLPIVATDIRGCRQVVDRDRTGILVPPRDAPALAAALERLADDEVTRRRMGAAAREKARREFDDRRCIELTLDVYARLGASPRAVAS
ncbi:MAG TPA: glycosyltransferase family 4 protein [Acidimicrobiia bacterium]|nr:glycosyltransferase family 4 protein [Acidimicrobiia bacterium]